MQEYLSNFLIASCKEFKIITELCRETGPHGYGRRFIIWRSWVRIPAPWILDEHFSHWFVVKIVSLFVEKTKINKKRGRRWSIIFFKKYFRCKIPFLLSCFSCATFSPIFVFSPLRLLTPFWPTFAASFATVEFLRLRALRRCSVDAAGDTEAGENPAGEFAAEVAVADCSIATFLCCCLAIASDMEFGPTLQR